MKTKKKTTTTKVVKVKIKKEDSRVSLVEKLAKELLGQLEMKAKMKVTTDQEGIIYLQLETDDPGVLIGYHGETLFSLQTILSLMTYRQVGEWVRVVVNVNDYRERRQESLEKMALSAAQRVKFSGETQSLPPMPAAERRVVHLFLANDPEVATESEGEGYQRRVVVKPRK